MQIGHARRPCKDRHPGEDALARDSCGSLERHPLSDSYNAVSLVQAYAAFNPHATFRLSVGEERKTWQASAPDWNKWRPSDPTSPHWYTPERLRLLVAAYIAAERDGGGKARTVREFVSEFRGLSATAKQKSVTEATGSESRLVKPEAAQLGQADSRLCPPQATGLQPHWQGGLSPGLQPRGTSRRSA